MATEVVAGAVAAAGVDRVAAGEALQRRFRQYMPDIKEAARS